MILDIEVPADGASYVLIQQFAGTTFKIRMSWNAVWETWMMELYDVNDKALLGATPMVTGVRDLIGSAQIEEFTGRLLVLAPSSVSNNAPPKDAWANGWKLIWTDIP